MSNGIKRFAEFFYKAGFKHGFIRGIISGVVCGSVVTLLILKIKDVIKDNKELKVEGETIIKALESSISNDENDANKDIREDSACQDESDEKEDKHNN